MKNVIPKHFIWQNSFEELINIVVDGFFYFIHVNANLVYIDKIKEQKKVIMNLGKCMKTKCEQCKNYTNCFRYKS